MGRTSLTQPFLINPTLHRKISLFWVCLTAAFLPLYVPMTNLLLGLWLLSILLFRTNLERPKQSNIYLWLCVLIYIGNTAGMLITNDIDNGWFNLSQKLPLLLFPFAFFFNPVENKERKWIALFFVIGCVFRSCFTLNDAWKKFQETGDRVFFYYERLSTPLHPAYLAMLLCIGICSAIYLWSFALEKWKKALLVGCLLLFATMIIMLQAKATFLFGGLLLVYCLYRLIRIGKWKYAFVATATVILLFTGVQKLVLKPGTSRVANAITNVTNAEEDITKTEDSSLIRKLIWQCAAAILPDLWLTGTGSGDVRLVLKEQYRKRGIVTAEIHSLNAHNQFLQVLLGGGIFGLFLVICYLGIPALKTWQKADYFLLAVLFLLISNMLVESMLEAQWGISVTGFFCALGSRMNFEE